MQIETATVLDLRKARARLEKLAERLDGDALHAECNNGERWHKLSMDIRNDAAACRTGARQIADLLGE